MFTYRIETNPENGRPLVWIDVDGMPVIRQPHHPNAALDPADPTVGAWETEPEAAAWAEAYIAESIAQQEAEAAAQAERIAAEEAAVVAAEEDRARLARIEDMLAQLLAK